MQNGACSVKASILYVTTVGPRWRGALNRESHGSCPEQGPAQVEDPVCSVDRDQVLMMSYREHSG